MPDREKVIEAIDNCISQPKCRDCPWEDCEVEHEVVNDMPYGLMRDALALLKEQEAVKPYVTGLSKTLESCSSWWYACGNCNKPIDMNDKYCRHCGREQKWDG